MPQFRESTPHEDAPPHPASGRFWRLIPVALSSLVLVAVLSGLTWQELRATLEGAAWRPALITCVLLPVSLAPRALRWQHLFNCSTERITFTQAMGLLLVGLALNLVLPASSGDVAKSYFGYRWTGHKERTLGISILDKCVALAAIALLGIPFGMVRGEGEFAATAVVLLLPLIAVVLLSWHTRGSSHRPWWHSSLERLSGNRLDVPSVVRSWRVPRRKLVVSLALSVLAWVATYLQLCLCFAAFGLNVPVADVFGVAPLLTAIRLNPLASNGLGTDEAALLYYFGEPGRPAEAVLAAALLYRSVLLVLPGLLGLALLWLTRGVRPNQPADS